MTVEIVPATLAHVLALAPRLREADKREIKAASGDDPGAALLRSFLSSTKAWTAVFDGVPEAIFGVSPWSTHADIGAPWMLASDVLEHKRKAIVRITPGIIDAMQREFPFLINYVDARHTRSISWLLWAGFSVDDIDTEYGVERRPFFRFTKVRSHV